MKKLSQTIHLQKFQRNPQQATIADNGAKQSDRTVLSDADLGHVSAAGTACVPTVNPEVLLGRHSIPDGVEKQRP